MGSRTESKPSRPRDQYAHSTTRALRARAPSPFDVWKESPCTSWPGQPPPLHNVDVKKNLVEALNNVHNKPHKVWKPPQFVTPEVHLFNFSTIIVLTSTLPRGGGAGHPCGDSSAWDVLRSGHNAPWCCVGGPDGSAASLPGLKPEKLQSKSHTSLAEPVTACKERSAGESCCVFRVC